MSRRPIADILAPPPSSVPSPAFDDAARARRVALRALRETGAKPLRAPALAKLARCTVQVATNALHTLTAWRLIVERPDGYALAPVDVEVSKP